jgi:hypothetical protein
MEKHYHHFEDVEENKLIYTDIFEKYVRERYMASEWNCIHLFQTALVEKVIEDELKKRIRDFQMDHFLKGLE